MLGFIGRLILFLIVLSAIRTAVQFVQKFFALNPGAVARRSQPAPNRGGATLLQQDPVCGTYVASESSLKRIVRGKVIHFCSPECRDRYHAG